MKERKGSTAAKLAAWIAVTVSGLCFAGGVAGAFVMEKAGVYDAPEEEFRSRAFQSVADHYAVRALHNMSQPANNKWIDTNFRYGIIKAEEIDDLDLNDESIYLERNFTEEVSEDALYTKSYSIGKNTQFSYSGTLWGGYAIYENGMSDRTSTPVYLTFYDQDNGIFYHEADGEFYPVKSVEFQVGTGSAAAVCRFAYDFDQEKYRNLYVSGTDALPEEYLTFDMLEGTELAVENWDCFALDDCRYEGGTAELWFADSAYMRGRDITEETDYTVDSDAGYTEIGHTQEGAATYWVVVLLPEELKPGWGSDMFVQANTLITIMYDLRYAVYPLLALALAVCIYSIVWLVRAAGHRKGTEEIVMTAVDRMPFDLYLGFVCLAGIFCLILESNIHYRDFSYRDLSVPVVAGDLFLHCCMCCVALLTLLTFAVRVKRGKWWRNTVCFAILRAAGRGLGFALRNMSLLLKMTIIFGILAILEFYALIYLTGYRGAGIITWIILEIGQFLFVFRGVVQMQRLAEGGERLAEGDMDHRIDTDKMYGEFKRHGENLNSIGDGMAKAIDERVKSERFKTELITNVSHDIKTPLTSIINYVDLLEKEELSNANAAEYLEVLERQSARLKKLIEDLIEASKASTGNLAVHPEKLEAGVSMVQTIGEFEEKIRANGLELMIQKPDHPVYVMADGRHFWRVIDNLMNNICKYAQPGTRVYINLEETEETVRLTFRNTSRYPLNISGEELMERFVRGDSSRNTEGSGLGLSIAKSLMELMGGAFRLIVDGDLFKVVLEFDAVAEEEAPRSAEQAPRSENAE